MKFALTKIFVIFTISSYCVLGFPTTTSDVCGKRKVLTGTVYGGSSTSKGQWPWLVAFAYRFSQNYFCGGNLISTKHVLSGKLINYDNNLNF